MQVDSSATETIESILTFELLGENKVNYELEDKTYKFKIQPVPQDFAEVRTEKDGVITIKEQYYDLISVVVENTDTNSVTFNVTSP